MMEITPGNPGEIQFGRTKVLEGNTSWIRQVAIKDNLIISGSKDKTIRITPITLYPLESTKFRSVIEKYCLPIHLEEEITDLFKE